MKESSKLNEQIQKEGGDIMTFSNAEIQEEYQKSTKRVRAGKSGCVTESMIDRRPHSAKFVEVRKLGNFVIKRPVTVMVKRIRKIQQ